MIRDFLLFLFIAAFIGTLPFLVYFCVKYGTVAFYRAKQFIDKQKTGDSNE